MIEGKIARRYAKAFLSLVLEKGEVAEASAALETIGSALDGSAALRWFVAGYDRLPAARTAALDELFGDQALVLRFVKFVAAKGRLAILRDICAEYSGLIDEHNGIIEAKLVSAFDIPADRIDAIANAFGRRTGKTVRLESSIDVALLGGFSVEIGSDVYDWSIKGNIDALKDKMIS